MKFSHVPIMKEQCMQLLDIKPDGIYADCTAGGGGHSAGILERLSEKGKLVCIDKDTEALDACRERFKDDARVTFIHSDYKAFADILDRLGIDKVDGILIDLGISSYQIDNYERGFSYMSDDAPLDMRMDRTQSLDAAYVLNNYTEKQICDILRYYGEESFAAAIAKEIVSMREKQPFVTCGQLVAGYRQGHSPVGKAQGRTLGKEDFSGVAYRSQQGTRRLGYSIALNGRQA